LHRSNEQEDFPGCGIGLFNTDRSDRLLRGVFEVARNMGTSVQMIHEYYGKQAIPAVWRRRWGIDQKG
jgi:hypothetical protein